MKKIVFFALLCTSLSYAQDYKSKSSEFKISQISYEVESAQELKAIDWKDVKDIFSKNAENEEIEMSFALNYPNSKYKIKSKIKVGGKTKNIDSLITLARKGVNSIIKISEKYKN